MSYQAKILLVEDDRNFGEVLLSYLEMQDYEVTLATDGEAGFKAFLQAEYDLCIFDVMMPKKDGFTLAQEVREVNKTVPIMFLTAKSMKDDVINGFKVGADDYITKPFNSEELLYRIHAILKRSNPNMNEKPNEKQKEFKIGKYTFEFPTRLLTNSINSDTEKLSPKEAQLLRLFCLYENEVLPRSIALTQIWGEDTYFTARSMDVFVTKLRKYLKADTAIEIVNIHGNGFQLLVRAGEEV
jgi:DNA-binding response OmpR family regulator